jgi:hypothetical protein
MTGKLSFLLLILSLVLFKGVAAQTQSQRVYAVATSFYDLNDTISWHEFQMRWASKSKQLLATDAATLDQLRQTLGDTHSISMLSSSKDAPDWLAAHPGGWVIIPFDKLSPRLKVLHIDGMDIFKSLDHYPLAFPSSEPNYNPNKLTMIAMSGVTALTRGTGEMLDKYGASWAVKDILSAFDHIDFRHTSNEVSFAENCLRPGTTQTFGSLCSKDSYFDVIRQVGFNVIELTGNHNNDYGYEAYKRTFQLYKD